MDLPENFLEGGDIDVDSSAESELGPGASSNKFLEKAVCDEGFDAPEQGLLFGKVDVERGRLDTWRLPGCFRELRERFGAKVRVQEAEGGKGVVYGGGGSNLNGGEEGGEGGSSANESVSLD